MSKMESVWAKRFMIAAIIQGLIALILTSGIILGQMYIKPEFSRVIAFGSAGMWFTVGYIMYIVVGVIGTAVSALFYHYIEDVLRKSYKGIANAFAASHLILMSVGILASTFMMMYGGYEGAKAMLPVEVGGLGLGPEKAHEILAPLIIPIAISIGILLVGILLG
ncbi:MAG: hypothetical protein D6752_00755, partial [Candidatus Nitrosothermus koennekii]